jgi:hypothetical protein|tara:strand:- start:1004 stop:1189 length:186 start_codon:yes stop_codon:yes gene_type:complete
MAKKIAITIMAIGKITIPKILSISLYAGNASPNTLKSADTKTSEEIKLIEVSSFSLLNIMI